MSTLIVPDWPAPTNVVAATTTRATPEQELPPRIAFLNQVHGANVVPVHVLRAAEEALQADAVTGERAGDICAVQTADCLPVLFCSRNGGEIAAAHAGWRGLAAGVLENTVSALQTPPDRLLAWIGPAISQHNFEVGDDVLDAFVSRDPAARGAFSANDRGRWQADLVALARQRLARAGVNDVFGGRWCTYGDARRFHSYRRDPACGRLVSFILLK